MRAYGWFAMIGLLLAPVLAWAGPFTSVPIGHWAYNDCTYLAKAGFVASGQDFSGKHELSRYELGMAVAEPAAGLARLEDETSPAGQGMREKLAALPAPDRQRVGQMLARLLREFRDVLAFLGQESDGATKRAQALAAGESRGLGRNGAPGLLVTAPDTHSAMLAYGLGPGRLALRYSEAKPEDASLGRMGLTVPVTPRIPTKGINSLNTVTRDPLVRSLGGSVEYGLTHDLTLDLAYERMVKEGQGLVSLDTTYLRSLGLQYRLSPSTSLRLRYHIIEYQEQANPNPIPAPRYEDRLTEGRLSVNF